eukprot:symbB.v1.2.030050.t1/scaffold3346.1/size69245/5
MSGLYYYIEKWLNTTGIIVTSDYDFGTGRKKKGLLGTTAVGPNVNVTAQQIRQILVEFGVSGSDGPPIDIRTDAATDVGELLRRSAINREFTLSRAGPQEHNVIGSAERGVREVKEAIAVARLELAKHQLDIVDSLVGWDGICRYVVAMHNLHGKKFGKTPRELLRDSPASKENPVGLACSTTEPCLYGGVIDGSPTLLLCYVDDLLIASSTDKAFHRVFKELSKHVKVRETGRIALGKDGGGSLKFLGRVISRRAGFPSLVMQVDPSYMDAACEEFGIKVPKGVVGPPDIKPNLEATSEESPISPEAHSRYRRVLGRLAWLAQTRMDLLHYTSLLASGQSEPKPGHEKALRQVLRFVATDSHAIYQWQGFNWAGPNFGLCAEEPERHIEIRLCWLRRLLNSSILELTFCRGDMNLSDMFTKCVSQALFQSFRTALGFLLNDLRLSVVISGSEKQKALDDEEESESLRDLEGKPLGKTSKLTQRVFQVFQLRESFQRGRRCMLCDDVIEDDLLVEGEGEVLNSVSPSAAVVGSAASSLSGVTLTVGVMSSSSDKDEDRRSVREAREEAMAKEGFPDAKESKKKRRRREKKKKGKTPGDESKVEKSKEDEMEEVKKDHLKQKVDKGKKGKGKGEKGKGKDKGKGKKGKGKGEVASPSKPRSRPSEPPIPPPAPVAGLGSTSRNVMADQAQAGLAGIAKRWSTDKPFVAVSGDPDHPDPQWVEKQQKELKEKMRKEIQDYEDEKSKKLRRAQGKEEESSSTESGSTDSEDDDEVSKTAKKVGIAVESFKRKSGVTEAGKRMLDQTLDEIVSQFLQSPSMMSQRIMIASWKLAKLVLVAAELIRT